MFATSRIYDLVAFFVLSIFLYFFFYKPLKEKNFLNIGISILGTNVTLLEVLFFMILFSLMYIGYTEFNDLFGLVKYLFLPFFSLIESVFSVLESGFGYIVKDFIITIVLSFILLPIFRILRGIKSNLEVLPYIFIFLFFFFLFSEKGFPLNFSKLYILFFNLPKILLILLISLLYFVSTRDKLPFLRYAVNLFLLLLSTKISLAILLSEYYLFTPFFKFIIFLFLLFQIFYVREIITGKYSFLIFLFVLLYIILWSPFLIF